MQFRAKLDTNVQWHPTLAWGYAMAALKELHVQGGVLLNGYIDATLIWRGLGQAPNCPRLPHRQPWVGFLHHPPFVPEWYSQGIYPSAQQTLHCNSFGESLPYCLGLFTLSRYLKYWIEKQISGVQVNSVLHPTQTPEVKFTLQAYHNNKYKKVVHIGWWLRKVHSFYRLKLYTLSKVLLMPFKKQVSVAPFTDHVLGVEGSLVGEYKDDVNIEYYKHAVDYDRLLSENIVFVDLYDSSANNIVVECMVRNTPLIVNRHSAVVEYLGEEYPLYFTSLRQAETLIEDIEAITAGHLYLSNLKAKSLLSISEFAASVATSEIYRSL